jgi:hypothetical protein
MEAAATRQWFLRKYDDGALFGPLPFEQLARWASSAQVAPRDSVSSDGESWIKAPMLPELGMDWIVEVTSESLYGPTTLGAIREFMRLGEIDENTWVINSCDATRRQVRDIAPLLPPLARTRRRARRHGRRRVLSPPASRSRRTSASRNSSRRCVRSDARSRSGRALPRAGAEV